MMCLASSSPFSSSCSWKIVLVVTFLVVSPSEAFSPCNPTTTATTTSVETRSKNLRKYQQRFQHQQGFKTTKLLATIDVEDPSLESTTTTNVSTTVKDENASSSTTTTSSTTSRFDSFDYTNHWYPVVWADELRLNEPTKVTVFDVDYVVAKTSDTEVMALEDRCPHKAAALSQGRLTASGNFQCAYHGWSFDGQTGECVEIPQIVQTDGTMPKVVPSKSCANAIPAQIHQGMVWLFPSDADADGNGGRLERALQAPPPPTVKEVEELGFKNTMATREMPVDWPIVVSNICDPDHGIFAHQSKAFDWYSASAEFPLTVHESFPNNGTGFVLSSEVPAVDKLLKIDQDVRNKQGKTTTKRKKSKKKKKKQKDSQLMATSTLYLPNHLQLKRVDENNQTTFVNTFYVCPTGVGRTRFMSAGYAKKAPKNWIVKLFLDNFLDQDTYLLATQQQNILSQEANDIRNMMKDENDNNGSGEKGLSIEDITSKPTTMPTRRKLFCLSTPTEKSGARLEQFWDATLLRVPNRVEKLLQLDGAGAFLSTPSREVVLDRKAQNLDISPSGQDVVKNCDRIISRSKRLSVTLILAKAVLSSKVFASSKLWSKVNTFLKPSILVGTVLVSSALSLVAKKIKAEYYFKYTDEMRRKDLKKIPKQIWLDK